MREEELRKRLRLLSDNLGGECDSEIYEVFSGYFEKPKKRG